MGCWSEGEPSNMGAGQKPGLSPDPRASPVSAPARRPTADPPVPARVADTRRDRGGKGRGAIHCPGPRCGVFCGPAAGWGRAPRLPSPPVTSRHLWLPSPVAPHPFEFGICCPPDAGGIRPAPGPPAWLPGSPPPFQTLPGFSGTCFPPVTRKPSGCVSWGGVRGSRRVRPGCELERTLSQT